MNRLEARVVLAIFLREMKQQSFRELQSYLSNPLCLERRGKSGAIYQIECQAVWDTKPGGNLRLIASIDDGGLVYTISPITADFLISPSGEILG